MHRAAAANAVPTTIWQGPYADREESSKAREV